MPQTQFSRSGSLRRAPSTADRARALRAEHPELFKQQQLPGDEAQQAQHGQEAKPQLDPARVKAVLAELGHGLAEQAGALGEDLGVDAVLRTLAKLRGLEEALRVCAAPAPPARPRHARSVSVTYGGRVSRKRLAGGGKPGVRQRCTQIVTGTCTCMHSSKLCAVWQCAPLRMACASPDEPSNTNFTALTP